MTNKTISEKIVYFYVIIIVLLGSDKLVAC